MHVNWTLSLPYGVSVSPWGDDAVALLWCGAATALRRLAPEIRAVLLRLASPGITFGDLAEHLPPEATPGAVEALLEELNVLCPPGLLQITLRAGQHPLATLTPTSPSFRLDPVDVERGPWVFSRFAYVHRSGREMLLDTPLNAARITLHDHRAGAIIHALAEPATVAQLGERVSGLPQDAIGALVELLAGARFLTAVEREGRFGEDACAELQSWEFHDLLFHARSRRGRHEFPAANTYPMAGVCAPLPAVKPVVAGETIELFRPELAELASRDPPLARVMEDRHSLRAYAAQPITAAQLGEFLYRTAAVRAVWQCDHVTHAGTIPVQISARPYPSGGALYPIEVYPIVQACSGLEPGLYHYDPQGHRLARLAPLTEDLRSLLADARTAIALPTGSLQVLLVLAARFGRVTWKYSGLSYALILKDLGGLFQNMYLAATAMGLAPCAIGIGDSDLFARAAGIDYYAEGSVGEFALGSRK